MLSKNPHKCPFYADFQPFSWYNKCMGNKALSVEELNKLPREAITVLYLQTFEMLQNLREQNDSILKQNTSLVSQIEDLKQQLAILINQRFGKKSERFSQIPGQLTLNFDDPTAFNEVEVITENGLVDEPLMDEVVPEQIRRKRPKGKRTVDLSGIDVEVVNHYLSEEELSEKMPGGWHSLKDEVYKELERIPASYKVIEHHIGVYAGNGDASKIIRGESPKRLLSHSLLTPSLAASVFTAKYINALPLNRISEAYGYDGINISRQVMARWMIKLNDYYLKQYREIMIEGLKESPLVHCDESPFVMSGEKNATDPQSKDYMWVYHSPGVEGSKKIYLYDYDNGSRSTEVIRNFLGDYTGIIVSDGYASYHTLARKNDNLTVAGCWVHCKRKYTDIVKTVAKNGKASPAQKVAQEAVKRITAIFHADNLCKGKTQQEILDNRQQSVKPLVDAYFAWVKDTYENKVIASTNLKNALKYSINQENYLRVFLENPIVPMSNNDAERSIKKFCVGKHSWHIIDSKNGARASAMYYSIAESAKANDLNPYEYFKYLMEQLKEYPRNNVPKEKLMELMPWSDSLPDCCRKLKKDN